MPNMVLDPGSGVMRIKELVKNADTWAPFNIVNANLGWSSVVCIFQRKATLEPLGTHLGQIRQSFCPGRAHSPVETRDKSQA